MSRSRRRSSNAKQGKQAGTPLDVTPGDWKRLREGEHTEPHSILGAHPLRDAGQAASVVRAYHPTATQVECLIGDDPPVPMTQIERGGLFAVQVDGTEPPFAYRLRFHFVNGETWDRGDPYRFTPTIGDVDLHLFNEGNHRRLWDCMGSHVREHEGERGVTFAVWAPSAKGVALVGDFNGWDGRLMPMRQMGSSGVFELFVPGIEAGAHYKYEIRTHDGTVLLKADPYAQFMQTPPGNASLVVSSRYHWDDGEWMAARADRYLPREPMAVYEVHLGSWMRVPEEGNRPLSYREIAPRLVEHVKRLGFTHIELLPIAEHPFTGSWGYQVTGYYAPTSRYGSPDDLRFFIDLCHRNDIGVILDWVPAHFPNDEFALSRFDGTNLYEHADPRLGKHPDWDTLIFNYGRNEVRNFLMANALYWLSEFHVDGLRVDAVASMIYLDYSREEGEWLANRYGGKENLEAIDLLRAVNELIHREHPGCFTIAEESTSWSGVTRPVPAGGLGFTFKWNMGWMNDTLEYFTKDPIHRKFHHHDLTFAMLYEYTEHFINALSHDEVVHGKRSLLEKMPGDKWQKLANLRVLLAYQYTRPGKVHLFMGTELATFLEWDADGSLEWHLADDPDRAAFDRFLQELAFLYRNEPSLWQRDPDPEGFAWIDCTDCENSIIAYRRRSAESELIIVLNLTPVPRDGYRIGVPQPGTYRVRLNSDDAYFGGSGYSPREKYETHAIPMHGLDQSLELTLPPLASLVLMHEG